MPEPQVSRLACLAGRGRTWRGVVCACAPDATVETSARALTSSVTVGLQDATDAYGTDGTGGTTLDAGLGVAPLPPTALPVDDVVNPAGIDNAPYFGWLVNDSSVRVDGVDMTGTEEAGYVRVDGIGSGTHTFERVATPS